jgi:hypothetical protein
VEPIKCRRVTLVDLLERVLDKGLVLNADVVITLSGIPLIGINLRAALAGMTTMVKHGLMVDLDRRIREYYKKSSIDGRPSLREDETILLRTWGSYLHVEGSIRVWRLGHFYLTDRRLMLHRNEPVETLLEISLEEIKSVKMIEMERLGWRRRELQLQTEERIVAVHAEDTEKLFEDLKRVAGRHSSCPLT